MIDTRTDPDRVLMQFWREYPERIVSDELLSRMSARQYGAWHRIVTRLKTLPLPGVADFDEKLLSRWSTLSTKEWAVDRAKILSPFMYDPETRTLHCEFVKYLYAEQYQQVNASKKWGSYGGKKSHGKAKSDSPSTPRIPSPYGKWEKRQLISLEDADLESLFNPPTQAPLDPPSTNKLINEINLAEQLPSPLGGAALPAANGNGPGNPKRMSTDEFREAQERVLRQLGNENSREVAK